MSQKFNTKTVIINAGEEIRYILDIFNLTEWIEFFNDKQEAFIFFAKAKEQIKGLIDQGGRVERRGRF